MNAVFAVRSVFCAALCTAIACAHGPSGAEPKASAEPATNSSANAAADPSASQKPAARSSSLDGGATASAGELPGEAVLDEQPQVGPLPPFDAPVPRELSLKNGLRVLVMEKKGSAIEAVQLVVKRGASADPPETPGLASLTAAMLEAGSAGRSQTEIAQAADALGASLHAAAGEDATAIAISGLAVRAQEMVALFRDVARKPNFDEGEWNRLKAQRLAGLRAQRAEPGAGGALAFAAAVYGKHPLARPVAGTPESVGALRLADAKAFFASFAPADSALIAAGGMSPDELLPLLEAAFGDWKGPANLRSVRPGVAAVPGKPPAPPPPPASERPRLVMVDYPGKPQSVLRVGEPSVPRSSPDVLALRLLDAVLGGSFTSRLNQNLREQHGYAYGAGSQFAFGAGPGPFVAGASVKTEVTGAALREMLGEVRRAVQEPLEPEELRKGKALLAFDLVTTLEHADSAAGSAASIFLYELPLDEYRTFVQRLAALDAQAVQAAARRAVDPDSLTVVIAGDVEKVEPQLDESGLKLGKPQLRDPDGKLIRPAAQSRR